MGSRVALWMIVKLCARTHSLKRYPTPSPLLQPPNCQRPLWTAHPQPNLHLRAKALSLQGIAGSRMRLSSGTAFPGYK